MTDGESEFRASIRVAIRQLVDFETHATIDGALARLGLPKATSGSTKRELVNASLDAALEDQLPEVAERVLAQLRPEPIMRNRIQEALWSLTETPHVDKRARREIAKALDIEDLLHNRDRFMGLLDSLWILDTDPFGEHLGRSNGLRQQIDQHVVRTPGDWSVEDLFEQLGAFDASGPRFATFLEGLVSADVVPDEPAQRHLVDTINTQLRTIGFELGEVDVSDGYPVFSLISTQTAKNKRPKNLIFASSTKPDIRFRDAINNDIEIVDNADDVLVYDRPIGPDGVRWRDLQAWWKHTHDIDDDNHAKSTLYKRLRNSLPPNSPPQDLLFVLYHEIFAASVQDLPALLPEVWLHWDPKTVKQRGVDALLRFRMDFLLLLPQNVRVVIEVDGMQHYATDGRPDPAEYAENMRGDRELKLSGYEVFRFGATELQPEERANARATLQGFFTSLFRRYEVPHAQPGAPVDPPQN